MKKVQILMSTYNGEKYISQQVDSILHQNYKHIDLLIRDDGSSDSTGLILEEYNKRNDNIHIFKEVNKGVVSSFFDLVSYASDDADFFAFSDQDDFWKPNKISRAVELLEVENEDIPLLYFSRLDLVDENLNLLKKSQIPLHGPSFENALIQNIATGCTIVFNNAMLKLFREKTPSIKNVTMHDSWFYLLGAALGKIVYDDQSNILYRQHSSNVIGMADTKFKSAVIRYKNYKKQGSQKPYSVQAEEFYRLYKNKLNTEQCSLIEEFLFKRNYSFQRIRHVIRTPLYRQNNRDTYIFKLLYVLNKY